MVNYWPGNDASTHACLIDQVTLYSSLNNPLTQSGFLTPGWTEPTDLVPSAWSIKIYYSPTEYKQFGWYYKPETMRITNEYGQRGFFEFGLCDALSETSTDLPFQPVEDLFVWIQNYAETYTYAAGYIKKSRKKLVDGFARDDGTEQGDYSIQCVDLFAELERKPVKRVYTDVVLGFLVKDVIQRYTTLDASDIDTAAGLTIEYKRFTTQTPAQVLQWAADLMDWTYTINPENRKVIITNKTQGTVRVNFTVTDDNVYDYFDFETFDIGRDTDNIKNTVELTYFEKFPLGPVNVAITSNVVAAHNTNVTDWENIPPETSFYVNSDTLYRVEKNLTADPTKELRLSSAYAEASGTAVEGFLRGWRKTLVVTNETSIGFFKQIRGDDGIFTLVLSEDTNHFTFVEGEQVKKIGAVQTVEPDGLFNWAGLVAQLTSQ